MRHLQLIIAALLVISPFAANATIIQIAYTGQVTDVVDDTTDSRPDGASRLPPRLPSVGYEVGDSILGLFRINFDLDDFDHDFVISSMPHPLSLTTGADGFRIRGPSNFIIVDGVAPGHGDVIEGGWTIPTNRAGGSSMPEIDSGLIFDLGIANIEDAVGQSFMGPNLGRGWSGLHIALVDLSLNTPGYAICRDDCDLVVTQWIRFDLTSILISRVPEPVSKVPEPGTLALLSLGLLGLGLSRRRKQQA